MHAFDRLLGRRCFGLSLLLLALALAVVLATDEAGSTVGQRAARLAVFAPAVAVVAERLVLSQARARGELVALAALGASPWSQARGAMVAAWTVGALSLLVLLSPLSDVRSLFPVVQGHASFTAVPAGLYDPASGVTHAADGSVTFGEPLLAAAAGAPGKLAAALFLAPLSLSLPLWGGSALGVRARAGGAMLAGSLALVSLHLVAAGRAPAGCLVLAALPLAAQAARARHRGATA